MPNLFALLVFLVIVAVAVYFLLGKKNPSLQHRLFGGLAAAGAGAAAWFHDALMKLFGG